MYNNELERAKTITLAPHQRFPIRDITPETDPLDIPCPRCAAKRYEIVFECHQQGFVADLDVLCMRCQNCDHRFGVRYWIPVEVTE